MSHVNDTPCHMYMRHVKEFVKDMSHVTYEGHAMSHVGPTQSVMYVPLQVNRFHESILLIVQYTY